MILLRVCVCVCVCGGTDLFPKVVIHSWTQQPPSLHSLFISTILHFTMMLAFCCLVHPNAELYTCLSLVWTFARIYNSSKTLIRLKYNTKITWSFGSLFSYSHFLPKILQHRHEKTSPAVHYLRVCNINKPRLFILWRVLSPVIWHHAVCYTGNSISKDRAGSSTVQYLI